MIILFFFFAVGLPIVILPQGVTEHLPPEVRPSPPPCGWSTGFIATPLTDGRLPLRRDQPAFFFPMLLLAVDTDPKVPLQY